MPKTKLWSALCFKTQVKKLPKSSLGEEKQDSVSENTKHEAASGELSIEIITI